MDSLYLKVLEQELNTIKNNNIAENNTYVDYKSVVCIKPWGYEFLVYESKKIGTWFLKIVKNEGTSLHTHFKKDTFIVVLSGTAKLTLVNNEIISLTVNPTTNSYKIQLPEMAGSLNDVLKIASFKY